MLYLIVIFIGLVFGSFATALIHRVPRDLPWVYGQKAWRSACAKCDKTLSPKDMVPVYSWIALRGRCRDCNAAISPLYIGVELGVLLMCLLTYIVNGPTAETVFIILAIPFLVALLVIDLQFMILPNQLIAILSIIGLARAIERSFYFNDIMPFYMAVVSAAVFALIVWLLGVVMTRIMKKDALGFGDVKFFAMTGLWLGLENVAAFCLMAGAFGVVFSVFWKLQKKESVFPFGPALIAALFLLLIAPNPFLL